MDSDLITLQRKLNQFSKELDKFTPEPESVVEFKSKIKALSGLLENVNRKLAS